MRKESKIKLAAVFAVTLMLAVCFAGIFVTDNNVANGEGEFSCEIKKSEHGTLEARIAGEEGWNTAPYVFEGLSADDQIELSAEAENVEYRFVRYDVETTDSVLEDNVLTINDDCSVTAIFEPIPETTYTITIENATGGSATAAKLTEIKSGEAVKLTATAETGYKFGMWDVKPSNDGISFVVGDILYVYGDCVVAPVFVEEGKTPFYLTVDYDIEQGMAGGDGINVDQAGKTIKIGAYAMSGYKFVKWEIVSGNGCKIADDKSAETEITMNDQCRIKAIFEESQEVNYSVSLAISQYGTIVASPAGSVPAGTVVTLSVKDVQRGWMLSKFVVDSDKCKLEGDKLTVNDDCIVSAVFVECAYITFDTQGGNEIEPMAVERESIIGEDFKLPTPEKKDYVFKGWFTEAEGGEEVSGIVTEDITVYAHWEKAIITEQISMIVGIAALAVLVISVIAMIAGFRHPIIYVIATLAAILAVVAIVFYVGWIKF